MFLTAYKAIPPKHFEHKINNLKEQIYKDTQNLNFEKSISLKNNIPGII